MSAVQDSRRDALFGRDAELARVRDAASSRGAQSQSLLITGPAGIGKTALVEAAIDGMDAEVLRLTGSPLGQSRPFETAINGIATFEQSDTFEPIKGQIAQIIANAHAAQPTPVEVARTLISLMRTLPPREHATVVIFQDIHLYDEHTLQALAFFARQNHLYDQAYLMTARSGFELASFQGVDQLRLGPLPDQAAREALSHWADMIVPLSVAVSLNAASGGIPLILREIAATLCPAQLRGDFALPVLPTVTTAIRQCLGETLERLSTEQLRALAVFGLRPTVPQEVAAAVVPQAVKDDLLEQHILTGLAHALRVEHAALGWAAWQQLLPPARSALTLELAHAWSDVNDVTAAYYQALEGPLEQDSLTRVRKALDSGTRQEDPELSERVAEVAFRSRAQSRTADRLRWVTACLEAHHLGAAVEACKVAAAGQHGGDETFASFGCAGSSAASRVTPRWRCRHQRTRL